MTLLCLAHHRLVAKIGIATQQPRLVRGRQSIQELP
jgi:hypothetical protein